MVDTNGNAVMSLAPEPVVQDNRPGISLGADQDTSKVIPSTATAASRAFKIDVGLGSLLNKPFDEVFSTLQQGREQGIRQQAASQLDSTNSLNRDNQVRDLTSLQGGKITPDQVNYLLDPRRSENRPVDPDTVVEKGFSSAVVGSLDNIDSPVLKQAMQFTPNLVNETKQQGSSLKTKDEYILSKLQNANDEIEGSSYLSRGVNLAKSLVVPFYNEALERGQVSGVGAFEGGFFGENKDLQMRKLYSLPTDQFKTEVDRIYENLKAHNPYVAKEFLQTMLAGQTNFDIMASNVGSFIDAASIPGVAKLGVSGLKGIGLLNNVRTATKDVIDASRAPELTKATMSNAAGDASSAAVHTVVDTLEQSVKGTIDPQRSLTTQLTSNLKPDMDYMQQHAGRASQEIVNRIQSRMWSVADALANKLQETLRVDRVPELKKDPALIEAVKDYIKDDYRGMPNKILDIKGDDQGRPLWDRFTNTWWFEHQLGTEAGEFFDRPEAATASARKYGLVIRRPAEQEEGLVKEIAGLENELRIPPEMEADVHEMNRYQKMEERYVAAKQELSDLKFHTSETGGYDVKQQGLGWYLSKMTPVDETSPVMRRALSKTLYDRIFQPGWFKTVIGWARTPEEVLSQAENDQRHIATFGPSTLIKEFEGASDEIRALPHKYRDDWSRALDASRYMVDENNEIGYWFKSPNQLDDFYQRNFNRFPAKEEYEAYFAFVRNYELERQLRDMSVVRNQLRMGAELHSIHIKGENGELVRSPFFSAMRQKEMPGGDDAVAIFRNGKLERVSLANNMQPLKYGKELNEGVREGKYSVLRIYNPELRDLKGFSDIKDERIRYIVSDGDFDSKPLEFGQVPRRGGGHFDYKANAYFKQEIVNRQKIGNTIQDIYEGDRTLHAAMPIDSLAKEYLNHFNTVRELIDKNKLKEAEAYHAIHFDEPWKEHLEQYSSGRLRSDAPIHLVPENKSIRDMDEAAMRDRYSYIDPVSKKRVSTLVDGTRSGSDARQFQVQFTGPRDAENLMQPKNVGTMANPLFKYEPAAMVDPITTYERSLMRIVNSVYMDDMKINSIEHWLSQAKPHLDVSEQDLWSRPLYHYNNPKWNSAVDQNAKLNLLSAQNKINHFNGVPGAVETFFKSAQREIVNSIYGKAGETIANISNSALTNMRNPADFARKVTFHEKLGLFNIPQFLKQFTTHANIFAIAGARPASGGTLGMMLNTWANINGSEEILNHLDGIASKLSFLDSYRYKPGEWKEAYQALKASGFENIGGEHAFRDNPYYSNILQSKTDRVLELGQKPFQYGASSVRSSAWFTAYLEHRAENPLGGLEREHLENILSRASMLDHNMNRSANSLLHTGAMSWAGQFMAYSLRLTEMMTGKQLTGMEKLRLFTVSSMLYGLPAGASLYALSPAGDLIRDYAHRYGWDLPDSAFSKTMLEGAGAAMTAYITGKGGLTDVRHRMETGDWYNVNQFGPESYQVIENAMNSDSTLLKIMGGAPGTTLYNQVTGMRPVWNWASSFMRPDDQQYQLTSSDIARPLKEISSVNRTAQLIKELNWGRMTSKSGTYLTDVKTNQAILMAATGLVPNDVANITVGTHALEAQKENQKVAEGLFRTEIQRELQAAAENNPEQADVFHKNALAILNIYGYPYERRGTLMSTAINENISLVNRLKDDYFLKNVPPDERARRQAIYSRILAIESEKAKP